MSDASDVCHATSLRPLWIPEAGKEGAKLAKMLTSALKVSKKLEQSILTARRLMNKLLTESSNFDGFAPKPDLHAGVTLRRLRCPIRANRESMMDNVNLDSVSYTNLLVLNLLKEMAQANPLKACSIFGLTSQSLDEIRPLLASERLVTAASSTGGELIFSMRPNLGKVLAAPPQLAGALFAVSPRQPS